MMPINRLITLAICTIACFICLIQLSSGELNIRFGLGGNRYYDRPYGLIGGGYGGNYYDGYGYPGYGYGPGYGGGYGYGKPYPKYGYADRGYYGFRNHRLYG